MVLKITLLALIVSGLCLADPIVFTIQGLGTGTVDSTPFSDAEFTFTVTTDTTLITPFSIPETETGFETPFVSEAGISIDGFGTGTFTNEEQIFVSNTFAQAGITDSGSDLDILDGSNSAFSTYNLQSSIELTMPPVEPLPGPDVPTSLGNVIFTDASDVSFTASFLVPEPGTWVLCAAGALLMAGVKLLAGRDSFEASHKRKCSLQ
jgi:hypothetical protein